MYSTAVLKIDSASKNRANWLKFSPNSAIFGQNSANFRQFTHINFNLFHYAGNNPVRYTDPTGAFDWETNTITPNDTLSQITEDYNKQNGTNFTVKDVADANGIDNPDLIYAGNKLDFSNLNQDSSINSSSINNSESKNDNSNSENAGMTASNKVYQMGIGVGGFVIIGGSLEVGICYSEADGFDIYRTIGGGFGVGITGDVTFAGNFSNLKDEPLHKSTGNTAVIGVLTNLNYDLTNNAKFSGVGGVGIGGGVLWSYTRTIKGDIKDLISFFKGILK